MAQAELVRVIGGKGRIALIRDKAPTVVQYESEEAIRIAAKMDPKIELVEVFCTTETRSVETEVIKLIKGGVRIDGIVAPSEKNSLAVLSAVQELDWAGLVHIVGVGYQPKLLEALDSGAISALIVEDLPKMGERAVRATVGRLRDKPIDRMELLEPLLLTKANRYAAPFPAILGPANP